MISGALVRESWSHHRWWGWVVVMFAAQILVIYWLGERGPIKSRRPDSPQTIRFLEHVPVEWLALNDPTLFALPHSHGFSAARGLTLAEVQTNTFDWAEDPEWLRFSPEQMWGAARPRDQGGLPAAVRLPPMPGGVLPEPDLFPGAALASHTRLRLEGALAERPLLTPFPGPDPTNSEILTHTVVQMFVDPLGRPQSLTLLSSSGLPSADEEAIRFARSARFAPLPGAEEEADLGVTALGRMAWGRLVVDWHTLPLPPTNAVPPK